MTQTNLQIITNMITNKTNKKDTRIFYLGKLLTELKLDSKQEQLLYRLITKLINQ